MYLSLVFITAGLALLANALWPLILLPVVIVIVRRAVIDREERYLTAKFGEEYLQYNCQFAEYLYRLRGIFCWKSRGFQGEGGATTTSGGIMAG